MTSPKFKVGDVVCRITDRVFRYIITGMGTESYEYELITPKYQQRFRYCDYHSTLERVCEIDKEYTRVKNFKQDLEGIFNA